MRLLCILDYLWQATETVVQDRVDEITSLVLAAFCQHCPSADNTVDIPSRGKAGQNLTADKRWWSGPKGLSNLSDEPV